MKSRAIILILTGLFCLSCGLLNTGANGIVTTPTLQILPVTIAPTLTPTLTPTLSVTLVPTSTELIPTATELINTPAVTPEIGSTQISEKDGMKLVFVPAGKFQMGSDKGNYDEKPTHLVTLDSFWIDQTEVTNAMYAKCVGAGACQAPHQTNSHTRDNYFGSNQYADFPVIFVNWSMTDNYCKWAGRRLPTEAEWEKAARGTDARIYPWGNAIDCQKSNYDDKQGGCQGDTIKVGSYPLGASQSGTLDMAGNVLEWVADWYGRYVGSAQNNPRGPSSGPGRVLRGGAWYYNIFFARSTDRVYFAPEIQTDYIGFRCAVNN